MGEPGATVFTNEEGKENPQESDHSTHAELEPVETHVRETWPHPQLSHTYTHKYLHDKVRTQPTSKCNLIKSQYRDRIKRLLKESSVCIFSKNFISSIFP